ncbi:MAG: LamG domain-containing protein [Anaerolineae bacterium]|nr:LamG domain-containing protein [Anaerolineae bacterium]
MERHSVSARPPVHGFGSSALLLLVLLVSLLPAVSPGSGWLSAEAAGPIPDPADVASQVVAPPPGLVGWWPGDGDADDISGNGYGGLLQHGAGFAPGRVGEAFHLDGVSQYVLIPDSTANLDPNPLDPTVEATLDAWVYFDQRPSDVGHIMTIVAKSGMGRDLDLQAETDDRFHFFVAGGAGAGGHVVSSTTITPGRWYFIAATYEANHEIRVYVNGALETTVAIPGLQRLPNGNPVTIGESYVFRGRFLSGLVDEVELFNRVLTPAEVRAIFEAGSAGKCKPGTCILSRFYLPLVQQRR